MNRPTVTPHRVEPNRNYPGWVHIYITCPHCGREHVHGAREGEPAGHRAAHCHAPGGYVIEGVEQ